tara:strand:- start:20 stop:451 length:432 start_codon:yes stop_codon:yes gene_type:complete
MFIVNYFNYDSDSESLTDDNTYEDLSIDDDSINNNLKPIKRSMSYNSFFKSDNLINRVDIVDEYDLIKKINENTKDNKVKLDKLISNINNLDCFNKIQFNTFNNKINQLDKKINVYNKNNVKYMVGIGSGILFSVILLKLVSK